MHAPNTAAPEAVRYQYDQDRVVTHAVVPIELWRRVIDESRLAEATLTREERRRRLRAEMDAPDTDDIPFDRVLALLGVTREELENLEDLP